MALAEISVIPLGTPTSSIGDWIAEAVKVAAENKNVKYEVSSMGTLIEGKTSDILTLARKMHEAAFKKGIKRVVTTVTIDDRRDKEVTIKSKVAGVKKRLKSSGRPKQVL